MAIESTDPQQETGDETVAEAADELVAEAVDGLVAEPADELAAEALDERLGEATFDFAAHRQLAVDGYQAVQSQYEDCARAVESVLKAALERDDVLVHTLEARAKDLESFGRKAARPSEKDPEQPKYEDPLHEITDLAGVRVITLLLDDVERVNSHVEQQFNVLEKVNKTGLLIEEEKLGYHSVHYLVAFDDARCALPEYARYAGLTAEVQVRTIMQHAWAEIEHDIQYKAVETIPALIRRRFMALAGLLEIADREFQAISDEDRRVRTDALNLIERGDLDQVEVTEESLKAYLDQTLGPDGRMSSFSYEWMARVLKRLGFSNLRQVHNCVDGYNDDQISRLLEGSRQGQITRFEQVLLASMGEQYIERHPWFKVQGGWFEDRKRRSLARLREAGIDGRANCLSDEAHASTNGT